METLTLPLASDRRKEPETATYRYLTPAEALGLRYGQTVPFLSKDGRTVREVRVSGKVRTWKRDASRIEVPFKYGLYESATFLARDGRMVSETCPQVALLVRC